jgi:AraC-like DNA-binding protein
MERNQRIIDPETIGVAYAGNDGTFGTISRHNGFQAAMTAIDLLCLCTDGWRPWVTSSTQGVARLVFGPFDRRLPSSIGETDCILVEVQVSSAGDAVCLVRGIRRVRQYLPVVAIMPVVPELSATIVQLSRAGVDDFVAPGSLELGPQIRRIAAQARPRSVVQAAFAIIEDVVPEPAREIVVSCLEASESPCSVESLAAQRLRIHRRTMHKRLRTAGVISPSELLSWTRLVHAAGALRDERRSVEQVALTLGFGSGTALRNMFRRHAGVRPSELRGEAGFDRFLQEFRGAILLTH